MAKTSIHPFILFHLSWKIMRNNFIKWQKSEKGHLTKFFLITFKCCWSLCVVRSLSCPCTLEVGEVVPEMCVTSTYPYQGHGWGSACPSHYRVSGGVHPGRVVSLFSCGKNILEHNICTVQVKMIKNFCCFCFLWTLVDKTPNIIDLFFLTAYPTRAYLCWGRVQPEKGHQPITESTQRYR